jgi:adenine phosphoribosyltransferase
MVIDTVQRLIRDVPDFPKPGIVFKDITPLLADPAGFATVIDWMAETTRADLPDGILAVESRGFIFGAALARELDLPLQLVRKPGKLPRDVVTEQYALEYGTDQVEMHADAVAPSMRYALIDDVIATGGTAAAVARLVERQGASLSSCVFLLELSFLSGRDALAGRAVHALLRY